MGDLDARAGLSVAEGPTHTIDGIIGLNSQVGTFVNAHIQAIFIELAPHAVDQEFLLQADHVGAHAIGIASSLTKAIYMGYQARLARKMVRAVTDVFPNKAIVGRSSNGLKTTGID